MALILMATLAAAVLLTLRHQRYQAMHEMVRLHQQIQADRQALWKCQSQLAGELSPKALAQSVVQAKLALEPLVGPPATGDDVRTASVQSNNHGHP
ncbi:MAG: hypothetical protein IT440_03950 [Phycisphaeraceae bacterium]|nr:hypothetical protein [Phycisphaeraceae bacterium]